MLKKSLILLLCLLYTVSVFGVAYDMHYCGGETLIKKGKQAPDTCPMCHASAKVMKCCKTTHVEAKVKDAHVANAHVTLAKLLPVALVRFNNHCFSPVWKQLQNEKAICSSPHAPPPDKDLILIKNCSFRI